jgi:hypothetical protein
MKMAVRTILVVTDSVELGCTIQRILGGRDAPTEAVFSMTYQESKALLTAQRVEETALFVLELFRVYSGGLRAEGLVLADRWRRRKPTLVVSALYLADELRCEGYWDAASNDTLPTRTERIMRFPEECFQGFDRVLCHFGPMMQVPPQHEDVGAVPLGRRTR